MADHASNSRTLILTRSRSDCFKVASDYESLGYDVSFFPLIEQKLRPLPKLDLKAFEGIIITSQKAIPALSSLKGATDLKIFCVGLKTSQNLVDLGFLRSSFAPTAAALEHVIVKSHVKRLLYLSADEVKVPLHLNLRSKGFDVERQIVYIVEPLEIDIGVLKDVISWHPKTVFTFYSLRTLKIFSQQIANDTLNLKQCYAAVIHPDLKWLAKHAGFDKVITATKPSHHGFLEAVKAL